MRTGKDFDFEDKEQAIRLMTTEWPTFPAYEIEMLYNAFEQHKFVSTKMRMLRYYLENFVKPGEKFNIFSNFKDTLTILQLFLEEELGMKCVVMSGEKTQEERKALKYKFDTDDTIRGFVGNMKMCANGLNLQKANHTILFDTWWNPELERQALDRTDRIDQEKVQNKVYLLIRGTLEEKVHKVATLKCREIYLTMGKATMKDRMALLGCNNQIEEGIDNDESSKTKWELMSNQLYSPPSGGLPEPIVFAKDPWKLFVFSNDKERVVKSMEDSNYDYYTIKLGNGKTFNAATYREEQKLGQSKNKKNKGDKEKIESVFDVILCDIKE